jgi:hypothetical protein
VDSVALSRGVAVTPDGSSRRFRVKGFHPMRGGNLGTDVNVFMLQWFAAVVAGLVFAVGVGR